MLRVHFLLISIKYLIFFWIFISLMFLWEITFIETTLPYNYNSKNNSYTIVMQLSLGYYNYYATIPLQI
jgi:hypothetical protein